MDGNKGTQKRRPYITQNAKTQNDRESYTMQNSDASGVISIEQLRHLVGLLDRSDVSELELHRAGEGLRLVLRKAKAPESNGQHLSAAAQFIASNSANPQLHDAATTLPAETRHHISAHLVGIFHVWAKPRGGALVAIGDHVKVGQLIATIESLNVMNDVESPCAGRVVEILTQEGQPVEYGQPLMVIDSAVEEEGA